jgi:hypothetical protein
MEAKGKLEIEQAKRPPPSSSTEQQGWLAAVNTRRAEDKIRTLQADLDKKVS